MKQQTFEQNSTADWKRLETILANKTQQDIEQLPALYRQVCHDLSLAKQRRYTPELTEHLNRLVMNGHERLYSRRAGHGFQWFRFIQAGFPQALRRNAVFVWVSLLLFVLPGLVTGLLCYTNSELIYSFMSSYQVQGMEGMYDPESTKVGRERESDSDILMFGFYIKNNIGIGFRTFASGIFFCLGSIFFIVYNSVILGAVAGHLTQAGFTQTFYPFVIGHGAFELTAIMLSGAAGLKLGFSLINPGQNRRIVALREASKDAVQIVAGAGLMLLVAAFIEAFWSSSTVVPVSVKYSVGVMFWLLVIFYCVFSGRNSKPGLES